MAQALKAPLSDTLKVGNTQKITMKEKVGNTQRIVMKGKEGNTQTLSKTNLLASTQQATSNIVSQRTESNLLAPTQQGFKGPPAREKKIDESQS